MSLFRIRGLQYDDSAALLAFETLNRAWFEAHIEPREPAFYSVQGIAEHIEGYLDALAAGTWQPLLIVDAAGQIVGRANLKNIDRREGCAEVGYRIGHSACGQGLATQALQQLIAHARQRWQLQRLRAYVYAENLASQKVLERCGFRRAGDSGGELCFELELTA